MTTSVSSQEISVLSQENAAPAVRVSGEQTRYRIRHTLASRFLFLLLCAAIVMSALAYGTVHYWTLTLFSFGAVAILFLWVADAWRLGYLRVSRNILQLPILAMLALGCVQLLPLRDPAATGLLTISSVRTLSFDPYSTRLVLVQVTALMIYFAAVLVFTDTPRRLRLLVRTIMIFGFLLALFGLTQSFTSPNRVYWIRELEQSTAFGPFINRHHFAGYMELAMGIPLGLLFTGAIPRERKFIYLFAVGLMGIALMLTNSRGGIISMMAEIMFLGVITAFAGPKRKSHRHHREHTDERSVTERQQRPVFSAAVRVGLAFALIIALFGGVLMFGGEGALSRFLGTVNSDDPTTGRAHFWSVTLDIIKANPLIGTGLGAFGVIYTSYDTRNGLYRLEQAHNDYLQVLSDGGIVGAVIALFFVVMLFRVGLMRRKSKDVFRGGVATGALAGCFAVLVHSFFDFTLHTTSNALLFLVLAALATMNGRVEEVHTHRRRRRRSESTPQVEVLTTGGSS